jgi:peptidoglycan/LPS O-acetylase OafA/YrhL
VSAARLPGLDALRGIAALCVVGLHAGAVFGEFPRWFAKGYLGVDFFLMLSGYLMARITEPRIAAGTSPASFMAARYRRFWPVVALGSLIGIPYLWIRTQGDPAWFAGALAANLMFVPLPADRLLFPLNVPAWTILFELLANALHVFVLWRLETRHLALLALVLLALTLGVAIDYGSLDVGARPSNVAYAAPRVLLAYTIGLLLWRYRGASLTLPLPGWLAMMAMPAAILASWQSGYRHWSFDLAFVVLLCPLVIAAALNLSRDTALGRFSGEISFPLFAAHVPVLEAARLAGYGPLVALPAALAAAGAILWWTKRPARLRTASA